MWSKLIILTVMAVFLMAVGIPVLAHDGRISNLIDDPGEVDEHPWGGEHQVIDDPQLTPQKSDDLILDSGKFFFVKWTFHYYWISIRPIFLDTTSEEIPGTDVKHDTQTTPTPMSNDNNNGLGTRN